MAELETAEANACCSPAEQESCCDASAKRACCRPSHDAGTCGCDARGEEAENGEPSDGPRGAL